MMGSGLHTLDDGRSGRTELSRECRGRSGKLAAAAAAEELAPIETRASRMSGTPSPEEFPPPPPPPPPLACDVGRRRIAHHRTPPKPSHNASAALTATRRKPFSLKRARRPNPSAVCMRGCSSAARSTEPAANPAKIMARRPSRSTTTLLPSRDRCTAFELALALASVTSDAANKKHSNRDQ